MCLTCPYYCDVGQQILSNGLQVGRLRYAGRTQRTTVLYRERKRDVLSSFRQMLKTATAMFTSHSLEFLPVGQKRKTGGSPKNRYISFVTVT